MIEGIFIASGSPFIIWELTKTVAADTLRNEVTSLKNSDDTESKMFGCCLALLILVPYMSWTVLGLVTSQWPLFLGYLAYNVLIIPVPSSVWKTRLDSAFSAAYLMFILINHFHLDLF